eukprot:3902839-Prymnesium_polylepis.1
MAAMNLIKRGVRLWRDKKKYKEQLKEHRRRLLLFSKPIFYAMLVAMFARSLVDCLIDSGVPVGPWMKATTWLVFLAPCL